MDYNRELKNYLPLIKTIAKCHAKDLIRRDTQGYDMVLSVALEAAWRALETYNPNQGSKMSSYIGVCVRNRLADMRRETKRIKNQTIDSIESDLPDHNDPITFFEEHTDMQKVLTQRELKMVTLALDNNLFQRKVGKPAMKKNINKEQVSVCLNQARQKLALNDLNLPCRTSRLR